MEKSQIQVQEYIIVLCFPVEHLLKSKLQSNNHSGRIALRQVHIAVMHVCH